jgi:hypothetical protein
MWIYLECSTDYHCSQESEALISHSETTCDQSRIAKSIPIVKGCCFPEWQVGNSIMPPSGTILKHSTEKVWKLSTLSSAASRNYARTLVLQDMEKVWQESEAAYSMRSLESLMKLSPDGFFWKMSQLLRPAEALTWSHKLPKWGMILDGLLSRLLPWERYTKGNGGFCLPTPTAREAPDCKAERKRDSPSLNCILNIMNGTNSLKTNPRYLEWMMSYRLGWTELERWVIPYVQSKSKKRLKS